MRAFVAIDISENVRKSLSGVMKEYKRYAFFRVVPPDNMHLTLAFMSEISTGQADLIAGFLKSLAPEETAGKATAKGFDCFPSMHRPRVVILELAEENGKFQALYDRLSQFLKSNSIPFDDSKPFKPHLTLARIQEFKPQLRKLLDEMKDEIENGLKPEDRSFADLTPRLYKSILLPGQPPTYEEYNSAAVK